MTCQPTPSSDAKRPIGCVVMLPGILVPYRSERERERLARQRVIEGILFCAAVAMLPVAVVLLRSLG